MNQKRYYLTLNTEDFLSVLKQDITGVDIDAIYVALGRLYQSVQVRVSAGALGQTIADNLERIDSVSFTVTYGGKEITVDSFNSLNRITALVNIGCGDTQPNETFEGYCQKVLGIV